jgi:threonine/homoserine efflux transporter RhtA
MTAAGATATYWRRLGRALIVGGLGCALAGAGFLTVGPDHVSGIRVALAAVILAYGVGSATTGLVLRRRHRGAPEADAGPGPS